LDTLNIIRYTNPAFCFRVKNVCPVCTRWACMQWRLPGRSAVFNCWVVTQSFWDCFHHQCWCEESESKLRCDWRSVSQSAVRLGVEALFYGLMTRFWSKIMTITVLIVSDEKWVCLLSKVLVLGMSSVHVFILCTVIQITIHTLTVYSIHISSSAIYRAIQK
jgi:hypothetical protein